MSKTDGGGYSAIVAISSDRFLVKSLLRDVKLLRFDSFLLGASDTLLILVWGRLACGVTSDFTDRSAGPNAGDMAPSLPDIEPFGGVLRFLLGNKPNWTVCRDDIDEPDRGDMCVGEKSAPDTEEYAESFPVMGGLSGLTDTRFKANGFSSTLFLDCEDNFRRCPKSRLVRFDSPCGAIRPR